MNEEIVHILLVEDEAAHAELVGRAFESQAEKFHLKVASNLKEAREYLAEATPNLIIADLLLTDGKGIELLKAPEDLQFPVVVMTSHGDEEVAVEAMKVGALDYVVKSEATLADMPRISERALREWDHINQRKQAEEELRESEERYRRLFATISDAIMIFDAETRQFLDVNDASLNLYGYTKEEFLNLKHSDITAETEASDSSIEHTREGSLNRIPLRYHKKNDGTIFPVEISASSFKVKNRDVMCGIVRDITDRIQAEESLRESEERYRELVENAVTGFYQVDKKGEFLVINRKMAVMFGYGSQQAFLSNVGNVTNLYANPEERPKILEEINKKGFVEGKEVEFKRKNDESIWIKLNTRVTKNREGTIIYEGLMEDITERKQMEEAHKRLEDKLQQAYKMEAIGTLAGGIAHDFNNILTPIIIQSELALMDIEEKSPIRFNLQEVMKAGLRAKDLVKQILTFSRQSEQQPIPLKIAPIIKEAVKLLRASLPTTIEIRLNLKDDDTTINADPTQIHQVLMNLCTNAGHAMRDKGGVLDVSLDMVELDSEYASSHVDLDPGPYLKLVVSDTGHGISPEVLDRIFDPFFTTKDRLEGTGMGLAVVHGIIKNYGGEITVESELGRGTTFMVFFPSVKTLVADEPDVEAELPMGNERVLVVDDEKGMVDAIGKMLNHLGYHVVEQTSSVEALKIFEKEPDRFDLVITDQTMPDMTGMELAKIIMEIRSDIPIILCTGFSERVNEESAKAMGISAFVLKPIVMNEIANTIREVLGDEK